MREREKGIWREIKGPRQGQAETERVSERGSGREGGRET